MLFKNTWKDNVLYKYLTENNLLCCKQFGFQKGHSPEHAIFQLVEQINQCFGKNEFTLGVFVDLCKAFDTADHQILLKKLEYYGIAGNNLRWFANYLKDRKQTTSFEHNSTKKATVTCSVPQRSILGPSLFLLYVNYLHQASKVLNPIVLVGNANHFFSYSDVKGTLMQIWKSANIFLFIWKDMCWRFRIKTPFTFWDIRTWDMWNVCL